MCLASKSNDNKSSPTRKIHSQLMEIPIKHGFSPERHLTRYNLAIYKNPGHYISEKLRLVHGVKATENQKLKISIAWDIKQLLKQFDDIIPIWTSIPNIPESLSTMMPLVPSIGSYVASPFSPSEALASLYLLSR
jgi:hypothetical protein